MIKRILIICLAAAVSACQTVLIERGTEYGTLSLSLENSPVVEVVTKASSDAVSAADFSVYVSSQAATFSYVYKDMPSVITLPVGTYVVTAENMSASAAETTPDLWGQVRYAGESSPVEVVAGLNPARVNLTCRMANTAVSVVFGENIDTHFRDYSITAYTEADRKLEFTPSNTVGEHPAVAYFDPEFKLNYVFTGIYIDDSAPMVITGSKDLAPATHLHLTFRMSQQNGALGKPEIIVDPRCEDLYETITVDPSQGGSFVTQ